MSRLLLTMTLACFPAVLMAQVQVDSNLKDYAQVPGVAGGSLKSVGSDTMNNMMTLWTEGFTGMYAGVKPEVDGKGSSNALPALISGQATFGPMSRASQGGRD